MGCARGGRALGLVWGYPRKSWGDLWETSNYVPKPREEDGFAEISKGMKESWAALKAVLAES